MSLVVCHDVANDSRILVYEAVKGMDAVDWWDADFSDDISCAGSYLMWFLLFVGAGLTERVLWVGEAGRRKVTATAREAWQCVAAWTDVTRRRNAAVGVALARWCRWLNAAGGLRFVWIGV